MFCGEASARPHSYLAAHILATKRLSVYQSGCFHIQSAGCWLGGSGGSPWRDGDIGCRQGAFVPRLTDSIDKASFYISWAILPVCFCNAPLPMCRVLCLHLPSSFPPLPFHKATLQPCWQPRPSGAYAESYALCPWPSSLSSMSGATIHLADPGASRVMSERMNDRAGPPHRCLQLFEP